MRAHVRMQIEVPGEHKMAHAFFEGLQLSADSKRSEGYFFKLEEVQLTIFLTACKIFKPSMILDIGANVGFYTLISDKFFKDVDKFCFEPTPETYRNLAENLAANCPSEKVRNFNVALSSNAGSVEFIDFGSASGRNGIAGTSLHPASNGKRIDVETNTIDNIFSEVSSRRAMLKIDVEGHEQGVLAGGSKFLSRNACLIQIEAGFVNEGQDFGEIFSALGYRKLLSIGPDQYYTNSKDLFSEASRLSLLETAMTILVEHRWNRSPLVLRPA